MEMAGAVAVLVLTPIIWILSHKIFTFIYFGNIGQSIIKELIECGFISLILVALGGALLDRAFDVVGTVLKFALKAVLILAAIVAAVVVIYLVADKVKKKEWEINDVLRVGVEIAAAAGLIATLSNG